MVRRSALAYYTKHRAYSSQRRWRFILEKLIARRASGVVVSSSSLAKAFCIYQRHRLNQNRFLYRSAMISYSSFSDVFNLLSDNACISHFRFLKEDVVKLSTIVSNSSDEYTTERNRYTSTPLLVTCVILSRLATPYRWTDWETFFRNHTPQLSETFWEGVDAFLDQVDALLSGAIAPHFISERESTYAQAVEERVGALDNGIGFIDGTVIKIARLSDQELQRVVYNGHKRTHALKFQAVVCPDGLLLHVYGPVEARRHDWTLYCRSQLDQQLEEVLVLNGKQYCLYGNSGYSPRIFLQVPFQGSTLNAEESNFNKAIFAARITVEWILKEVKLYWTHVDFRRKMRVLQAPVGLLYLTAMLLMNFIKCFYGNQVSKYFKCAPPSLDVYLATRN